MKYNAQNRARNIVSYVCLKTGKRYGSCPYKMRIIRMSDTRFEVQFCGKHNHQFEPIHYKAGSKRASHFGEETPAAKISKTKRQNAIEESNTPAEAFQNGVFLTAKLWIHKIWRIIFSK